MIDLNVKLSENFKLWEFVTSQTAQRKNIDNTPTTLVIDRLTTLCREILEPAREELGPLRISSGYRCSALNAAVGGSSSSDHMLGYAADVIPVNASKMQLAKWVAKNGGFDQLILEYGTKSEPAWIHVSINPKKRRQVLRVLAGTGYQSIQL